ncbi:MAG: NAD(P)-dependent oxidoreductase [Anaerolineales bacterium]|nr:NAD(P)-dependent oxidoreductase [Anaerolineales bacterium]
MNVGLIGVGTMGILTAESVIKAGHRLAVYDVSPESLAKAERLGAIPTSNPAQVAGQAEIILMLLPTPRHIEQVVTGADGLLNQARQSQVIIDLSTVDPDSTRRMGARAAEAGVAYLDAPILGRPSAHGRWVLPVGGDAAVVERCRPVLEVIGRKVIHVGALGAGNTLKLLNALMFSAINVMTAEMMAIATKAGLAPELLYKTLAESEAATVSGLFKEVGDKIVRRDFAPTFAIDLLCKDNGLAVTMARSCGAPPVVASVVQTMNELARARGLGNEDTSALIKVYEALLDGKAQEK